MMHLYSTLLCIVAHPKRFTIMGGISPQPPPVCSIHLDDVTAATGQRRQCAHHTPATGGEERESHRANQVYALTTHQLQVERRERVIEPIKCMCTPHTSYRWRGERVVETIKCMCSPHTSYRWRGERESHRANQVYVLTTHQLQVERRESHRDNQVANQVYALTTHQLQVERRESHRAKQVYALTTHQLQVERRESHRANQMDRELCGH